MTDNAVLAANIGREGAARALATIEAGGGRLLSGPGAVLLGRTQRALREDAAIEGVVLLGGVDVVPSRILLTVPPEMRALATTRGVMARERDRLQVWTDDSYGDKDDDGVPELPVSRIPDGKSAALVLRALTKASPVQGQGRALGVRNSERPFADAVFAMLDGPARMSRWESDLPGLPPYPLDARSLYLMLHGHWREGHVFRGENEDGYPEAFSAKEIPDPAPSVVFSGCCYGALAGMLPARDAHSGAPQEGRKVEDSIALTCLLYGTNAFVGCTAIHYSPDKPPFTYLGEPMHRLFWQEIAGGHPPARALLNAKTKYASGIPHLAGGSADLTLIEHKIFQQFTCLGLGW